MQALPSLPGFDADEEYRAIEATLLGSTRGRWFLSEHGRRARRLDTVLLEDAINRLKSSLRQPPALLGQLQAELDDVQLRIAETKKTLTAKPLSGAAAGADAGLVPAIVKAAEDIHAYVWSLQANSYDVAACEGMARNASKLYALSQQQAANSTRTLQFSEALDTLSERVSGLIQTVTYELSDEGSADTVPAALINSGPPTAAAAEAGDVVPAIIPPETTAPSFAISTFGDGAGLSDAASSTGAEGSALDDTFHPRHITSEF